MAEDYPITLQGILKHLTILESARLVAVHQLGREKCYTLSPDPLKEVDQWVNNIGAKWDERLLSLKTMLENE